MIVYLTSLRLVGVSVETVGCRNLSKGHGEGYVRRLWVREC